MVEKFEKVDWREYELEADDGFLNANIYPNPANQLETRKQLQSQHTQLQDYVNNTVVPALGTIPTKVSDLDNDTGFITADAVNLENYYTKDETYTKAEVQEQIGSVGAVTKTYVDSQDTATLNSAKAYTDSHASDVTKAYVDQQDGNTLNGTSKFSKLALASNHVIEVTDSNGVVTSFSIEYVETEYNPPEPEGTSGE